MSYSESELMEISNKLDKIIDRVKERSVEWWWLDQGDAPIYAPFRVNVSGKSFSYERLPKVSLTVALRTIRDNLKNVKTLDPVSRVSVINDIAKELNNIYNIISVIFDANEVVKKIENLVNIAKKSATEEGKLVQKQLLSILNDVKDIVKTKPEEWKHRREELLKQISTLSEKFKVEAKVVIEEKKPEKEKAKEEVEEEELEEILDELKVYEEAGEAEGA